MELDKIQELYPNFYEYLDEVLLSENDFYYYRQLYDVFDKLNYIVDIEFEKSFQYKIFPPKGMISFKGGFIDRPTAEFEAFELLIKQFENGKIKRSNN